EDLNHTDEDAGRRADEGERLVDDAHAHEYTVDHSGILEEPHPGEATDEQARPERKQHDAEHDETGAGTDAVEDVRIRVREEEAYDRREEGGADRVPQHEPVHGRSEERRVGKEWGE